MLQARKLRDLRHLAADVALVFDGDLHALGECGREGAAARIKIAQVVIGELRSTQQRDERAAVAHLRRAARSQKRVERVGRGDARVLEALDLAAHCVVFAHDLLQRFIADKAKLVPDGRKIRRYSLRLVIMR